VDYRLAKEMVENVRFWTDVTGLFHTDEMPSQGISQQEVDAMAKELSASDQDAIVFIFGDRNQAEEAFTKVLERAKEALEGVPYETRGCRDDGSTFYLRPRPGMSRMYPETDIPPVVVSDEYLRSVDKDPFTDPATEIAKLQESGLTEQLAREIYDSQYYEIFLSLTEKLENVKASFLASTLTGTLRNLEKEGYDISTLDRSKIAGIFKAVDEGRTAKESVEPLFQHVSQNPDKGVEEAIENLGLGMMSRDDLEEVIEEVLGELDTEGDPKRLFGQAMGRVMSSVRGKARPDVVSEMIKRRLKER
jgi:glutamyl-tRNA(Gln) amidotransferase subunit E